MTTLRLIPVLLLAASALLALKLSGLMLEGGTVAPSGVGVGVGAAMAQTQEPAASDPAAGNGGDGAPADAAPQAFR